MSTPISLDGKVAAFLESQPLFFVATAPASPSGHVNCSPKGGSSCLRVIDSGERIAFVDYTGSGTETIAHLRENGRITLMFASFGGTPEIVRVYGTGFVHELGTGGFSELAPHFPHLYGARSIIEVAVAEVRRSCGFGVPVTAGFSPRSRMPDWLRAKGEESLRSYREKHNRESLDGLPGFGAG